jgi:hypothetical protein
MKAELQVLREEMDELQLVQLKIGRCNLLVAAAKKIIAKGKGKRRAMVGTSDEPEGRFALEHSTNAIVRAAANFDVGRLEEAGVGAKYLKHFRKLSEVSTPSRSTMLLPLASLRDSFCLV